MNFTTAIDSFSATAVFQVIGYEAEDWSNWQLAPLPCATVPDTEDRLYVLKAFNVLGRGRVQDCYVNLSMPERIIDFVWFLREGILTQHCHHEVEGDVIPAVAIEGYGVYDQFYSRRDPEVGMGVLRQGLHVARQRGPIAEDLGYILRDEGRTEEAIAMFSIAVDEGPSSFFIFLERAALYDALDDRKAAERDRQQVDEIHRSRRRHWWQPFKHRM